MISGICPNRNAKILTWKFASSKFQRHCFGASFPKLSIMKGSRNQNNLQNKQVRGNRPTPEVRDNLDSRNNEEFNDVPAGHNKKETKADKLKKRH